MLFIAGFAIFSTVFITGLMLYFMHKNTVLMLSKLESISDSAMLHLKAGSATEVLNVETLRKEADVKLSALEVALKADASVKENTLPEHNIIKGKNEKGEDVSIDLASGRWEML